MAQRFNGVVEQKVKDEHGVQTGRVGLGLFPASGPKKSYTRNFVATGIIPEVIAGRSIGRKR